MNKARPKIVMLGAGGHAAVLLDILRQNNETADLLVAAHIPEPRAIFNPIQTLRDEEFLQRWSPDDVLLVNGIGMLPHTDLRERIYVAYTARGYRFKSVISPHSVVSSFAELGSGVQIMPGAIVQAGAAIGDNTIINTRAVIEHDCTLERHNHIAPGAILCGAVHTATGVFIGAGAVVAQNITIGENAVIGAGAVITKAAAAQHIIFSGNGNH